MISKIANLDCEIVTIPLGGRPVQLWRPLKAESYILNTAEEDFGGDERLPYWAMLWPASIALAQYFAESPDLKGKSLLELGAGLALPALAAARAGALTCVTDWYNEALDYAKASAKLNALDIQTQFLDWRHPPAWPVYDYIACADLLYERRNHAPILNTISRLLAPKGKAVFSDPERHMSPAFFEMASENGWKTDRHQRKVSWEGGEFQVDCWELSRG